MATLAMSLVLAGCAQVEGWIDSKGTVYHCGEVAGEPLEYCYLDDSADELSVMTDLSCHPVGLLERAWPTVVDCWYHCNDPNTEWNEGEGAGCNAHIGGCWCP